MAPKLADEYHGHRCLRTRRPLILSADDWERILAPISHPPFLSEMAEDEAADSLYIAGEMNRAEWLLAKERNANRTA